MGIAGIAIASQDHAHSSAFGKLKEKAWSSGTASLVGTYTGAAGAGVFGKEVGDRGKISLV